MVAMGMMGVPFGKSGHTTIALEAWPDVKSALVIRAANVYTLCIYIERMVMTIGKVFRSGNSQAVRLPKEFRFKGKEVEIFRRGDEVILREKERNLARP